MAVTAQTLNQYVGTDAQGKGTTIVAADMTTACSATPMAYTLLAGDKQVFTATAGDGWEFEKWQIDGEDVEGEEGTKAVALLTIPSKTSPVVFRACFKAVVAP